MPRLTNDAVMERYGYKLCSNCNSDMPVDGFVAGWCKVCVVTVGIPEPAWEEE